MGTRTDYIRNTSAWILGLTQRVRKFAVKCADTGGTLTEADVIGETRISYDGLAYGTAPTRGLVTQNQEMSAWNSGTPAFTTVAKAAYDVHGRVTSSTDALNGVTTSAYTPATDGPVTSVLTKNPLSHETTVTFEPAWGSTISTVDPNGKRSDLTYDPLGRTTAVWTPGRAKGTDTATKKYSYDVNTDGATVVSTSAINPAGAYITSYTLYDGLLRQRQTQVPSTSGGRVITENFYDTAGRPVLIFGAYHATGSPGGTLLTATDKAFVPRQTRTVFDGAGRIVASILQPYGAERWRSTTAYTGDRTDLTPPAGGTATSTVTDARGRTVELRQYRGATPTPNTAGSWDGTIYTFDRRGYQTKSTRCRTWPTRSSGTATPTPATTRSCTPTRADCSARRAAPAVRSAARAPAPATRTPATPARRAAATAVTRRLGRRCRTAPRMRLTSMARAPTVSTASTST
jgi:YD repeat-containing protein